MKDGIIGWWSLPPPDECMQIIVKTITNETVTLYVKDTDAIDNVKDNLSRHCYLEPADMLFFLIDNSSPFATHPVYPLDGKYFMATSLSPAAKSLTCQRWSCACPGSVNARRFLFALASTPMVELSCLTCWVVT